MSEDLQTSSSEGIDPLATSLALAGADRAEANAFLRDQRHHMHEQLKEIGLRLWELRLGVFLRLATAVVGVAVAGALGFMVWNAAHSNGLLIEPFSVPPDLAARGLTGQVIAAKLQDRLAAMQAQTNSGRPARSYANSWGEHGIKLDIPETGVSLTELDSFLREKLGHDTHVSGEIVRKAAGLALSARAGDESAPAVTGQEEDIDAMAQKLAESVYRVTQPFRYGMYLAGQNRQEEALPVFEALAKSRDKEDRLWGFARWALTVDLLRGSDAAFPIAQQALVEDPGNIGVYDTLANYYGSKGRTEDGLQNARAQLAHLLDGKQTYVSSARLPGWEEMLKARLSNAVGAYHEGAEAFAELMRSGIPGITFSYLRIGWANGLIGEHDLAGAHAALADMGVLDDARAVGNIAAMERAMSGEAGDWRRQLALIDASAQSQNPVLNRYVRIRFAPQRAYALAMLDRLDAAEAEIAAAPADCYACLRIRAQIAERRGQQARADWWFARAVTAGPSLPFVEQYWGRALLGRRQPDAAIAKFTIANKKSPHFADPLEGWGEALMAKNQSHLALAKFAEAEKYAPNWGRLHLKWGEALLYAGKKDEAKAQFVRAAQLDLTPTEKFELASIRSR